jgi:glutamate-1-semialdehyde 2,1-aminomutase
VYQAGTLSGNPLAMAAGLCVLRAVTGADYEALAARVDGLAKGLADGLAAAGVAACATSFGTLAGLLVGDGSAPLPPPRTAAEVRAINASGRYAAFFHELLDRGVALAPGAFEVLFCSLAHDDATIARTVELAAEAAGALAAGDPAAGDRAAV